jgi:NAD dependent epimerase/dehydratase
MTLNKEKILVTGADGFIGSHLTEELINRGHDVRAFVFYNSFNSWGWLDSFPKEALDKIEVFAGDIRDPNGVRKAMQGINIVFHLAALIAIPFSYHSPDSYVDTNIKGTLNVLQAARDSGCSRVLITSTSEVYGTAQYVPIDEKHPFQGQSPYSATKIGADRLAESFYRSFNTSVTIVRPFNVFGPRQDPKSQYSAVIPLFITALMEGRRPTIYGDGSQTRDFTYVANNVQANIRAATTEKPVSGRIINIACGTSFLLLDLLKAINHALCPPLARSRENFRGVSRSDGGGFTLSPSPFTFHRCLLNLLLIVS